MAAERQFDFDGTWLRGTNSSFDPGSLPVGYSWNAINMINVGGLWSCRPGYRCKVTLPPGKLQGATIFRPRVGLEQMVVCVDGAVYVAPYPFLNFRLLTNVQMLPHARQVWWVQTTQTARRRSTDFAAAIEVIEPREVLFIFDGENTAPAYYDGTESGHVRDNPFETPIGGPAIWVGDRLWVARGKRVYASDISNPFSFREQIYLGASAGFEFNREVTAMARTPSLQFPQLLIFTDEAVSLIQADIRTRSQWPTTDGFQREILQVGCVSQRSVVSHYGRLSWFSPSGGIVFFDAAAQSQQSGRTTIRDNEMMVSKVSLASDLSLVAAGVYGQFLMVSVPSEDIYNKHTWVLNNASVETLNDDSGPLWCGYWLGTRPVEWMTGTIAGAERVYHASVDADGQNRLWECFVGEPLDNGCPITWALETRGYFGQTSQTARKLPGAPCRFMFAELALTAIEEDLNLGVFYAGGTRGAFKQILSKKISVERGSIITGQEITAETELFAFKPQSRKVRTQDASQQSPGEDTGSCEAESPANENIDESFQLLVVGHGPATIRWIRAFGLSEAEDTSADPEACVDEEQFRAVRFDGAGAKSDDLADTVEELTNRPLSYFTATKTVTVSQDGSVAVGVGAAESVVSQSAADRVATVVATRAAENELIGNLPSIISIGEGFDE